MTGKRKSRQVYFEDTVDRFWSKVGRKGPKDCWLWRGTIALPNKCGQRYGSFGVTSDGRSVSYRAHRFAWMLTHGRIPPDMVVMHRCDVPLCCNPAHLKVGTQAENVADQYAKGRGTYGEKHGRAKLTEEQVMHIRRSDEPVIALAKRYGVHPTTIAMARSGKKWPHLPLH